MNNEYGHSCDCEQDWNFFTVKSESGMGQPNYNVEAGNIHIFYDQFSFNDCSFYWNFYWGVQLKKGHIPKEFYFTVVTRLSGYFVRNLGIPRECSCNLKRGHLRVKSLDFAEEGEQKEIIPSHVSQKLN